MKLKPLLTILTLGSTIALATVAFADDDAAPDPPPSSYDGHSFLVELVVVVVVGLFVAASMASNSRSEAIESRHTDFWGKPLGKTFSYVNVPKEPSSPQEIRTTLFILGIIYLALRLTCLSGCFNDLFQFLGRLVVDLFSSTPH